jgi:hypothetical protein
LIQKTKHGDSSKNMSYIGLDLPKKTTGYCIKEASGQIHQGSEAGPRDVNLDADLSWISVRAIDRLKTLGRRSTFPFILGRPCVPARIAGLQVTAGFFETFIGTHPPVGRVAAATKSLPRVEPQPLRPRATRKGQR